MIRVCSDSEKCGGGQLRLIINTERRCFEYAQELSLNELRKYDFDISEVTDRVTGCSIAPSPTDCSGDIDVIEFVR